jgi:hypothetical protein
MIERSLKFDPPARIGQYAVYYGPEFEGGQGDFRIYRDLGAAKCSWHHVAKGWSKGSRREAKILENVEGEWYVLYDVPKGTDAEDLPWYKTVSNYSYGRWDDTRIRKAAKPMTREEYAEWRVKVERERIFSRQGSLNPNHLI